MNELAPIPISISENGSFRRTGTTTGWAGKDFGSQSAQYSGLVLSDGCSPSHRAGAMRVQTSDFVPGSAFSEGRRVHS